jgi:hypothetical protein
MKDLGKKIYSFGYVVAATVLVIGVADYWFGNHQLTAFLSWAVLATIPWLVGRASLFVLAGGSLIGHPLDIQASLIIKHLK